MPQTSQTVTRTSSLVGLFRYPLPGSGNDLLTGRALLFAALGCVAVASLSLLVVAPAPSYDPWAWLLWGRELTAGGLSTVDGPAFKPLPVAVCALLAPLGAAAPAAWVLVARIGALLAIWLAFRLGRRLAGGSVAAGALAAAGVALCGAYLSYASSGVITGWLLAFVFVGVEAWRAGRPRLALACGVACGLLQVEAWPFLLALGAVLWRGRPQDRPLLAVSAIGVPAAWLVPELIGSGDLLRSAERARLPNPGQPALADVPALESLWQAAALPLWPLWVGVLALAATAARAPAARVALLPAAAGLAWVVLVATMAQLGGFSGEPRYALPGVALMAISGAVGLATAGWRAVRVPPLTLVAAVALVAVAALPRLDDVGRLPADQGYQWRLGTDLAVAIAAAGRDAVLDCGTPYVGPLRGPLLAYKLDVPRHVVEPDDRPSAPGVVFRSRLDPDAEVLPAAPAAFGDVARTERWRVLESCPVRIP